MAFSLSVSGNFYGTNFLLRNRASSVVFFKSIETEWYHTVVIHLTNNQKVLQKAEETGASLPGFLRLLIHSFTCQFIY